MFIVGEHNIIEIKYDIYDNQFYVENYGIGNLKLSDRTIELSHNNGL